MPLEPIERVVLLTQYEKCIEPDRVIRAMGRRMSRIGRLPDTQILDLLEAFEEKNNILEKLVSELIETGTIRETTGAAQTLVDICTARDN